MPLRMAGAAALAAFLICVVAGLQADNPFATTVSRAMLAMLATFVVGLVAGHMSKRMLDDNLREADQKLRAEQLPEQREQKP